MSFKKLAGDEIEARLKDLPGWSLDDGKLHRKFEFADFREAFGFMATIATAAEAMNHHPEWFNVYRTVEVWMTTHDAGGVSEKDFALAAEMNARAR